MLNERSRPEHDIPSVLGKVLDAATSDNSILIISLLCNQQMVGDAVGSKEAGAAAGLFG
jgi:hypothetical protein